jgi:hypothetical protein
MVGDGKGVGEARRLHTKEIHQALLHKPDGGRHTSGALDQRIAVKRLVEGYDEAGQPIDDWLPNIPTWAAVEPLVGRDYIAADA